MAEEPKPVAVYSLVIADGGKAIACYDIPLSEVFTRVKAFYSKEVQAVENVSTALSGSVTGPAGVSLLWDIIIGKTRDGAMVLFKDGKVVSVTTELVFKFSVGNDVETCVVNSASTKV